MKDDASGRPSGFYGAVSVQTLPEIIQLYVLANVSGLLEIHPDAETGGSIWFDNGAVVRATCTTSEGAVEGEEAFYAIMMWDSGAFSMRTDGTSPVRNVFSSWQQLVLESGRRADEMKAPPSKKSPSQKPTGWTARPPKPPPPEPEVSWDIQLEDLEEVIVTKEINPMNVKEALTKLSTIDGFIGASLVDSDSGMPLGSEGGGNLNLDLAAAGNTEVVKSKRKVMNSLNLKDAIEDILITLGKQYHLIRPLRAKPTVFFYIALDRSKSNLAMARIALADVEKDLQL